MKWQEEERRTLEEEMNRDAQVTSLSRIKKHQPAPEMINPQAHVVSLALDWVPRQAL